MYDASLGKKSNETSGVAIANRKHEGDVSTFHIQDNLSRSIRQLGCILVDLIPSVYGQRQMLRILGDDGTQQEVKIGQVPDNQPKEPPQLSAMQKMQGVKASTMPHPQTGMEHVYDLGVGKYDVVVDTGPSFTTQREQTAAEMAQFLKEFPQAAPLVGDIFVKALDWPQADEIAERLRSLVPANAQGGLPPQVQQMIDQGKQMIGGLQSEVQKLQQELADKKAAGDAAARKNDIEAFKAETDRLKDLLPYMPPQALAALGLQTQQQAEGQPSPVEPPAPPVPPQIHLNVPEGLGHALGNAVTQGMQGVMSSLPPLQVNMPTMKNTIVRGADGLATHSINEPVQPGTIQ
jgi:hypothetical protein